MCQVSAQLNKHLSKRPDVTVPLVARGRPRKSPAPFVDPSKKSL